ncbi:hypothetical protein ACVW0Y_002295 [Pseudomonas sp. TE3786]
MANQNPRTLFQSLRPVTLAFAALLIGIPTVTQAYTVCEKGRVKQMEIRSGGYGELTVSTDNTPATLSGRQYNWANKPAAVMWRPSVDIDYTNTRDRTSLLRAANAAQRPVYIVANDPFCFGTTDNFAIILCTPGDGDC